MPWCSSWLPDVFRSMAHHNRKKYIAQDEYIPDIP
ncbi:Hypothetical protein BDP_0308 [Bifidobacterium dentium Bd1]|uniref:Uncharacterized protein n=1 Tax=Bifidobacterium dentium (strain ATCC 27534 / DSM 20436 / JCM 1195 / Bd1) TaxID=401473 RepID=D2Q853_BIFDB|nr:Hypothetical protein BDP_0308 [Bifidobacterium dentium Bd1]